MLNARRGDLSSLKHRRNLYHIPILQRIVQLATLTIDHGNDMVFSKQIEEAGAAAEIK